MTCIHCQSAEDIFSQRFAERELKNYRKHGASSSTQILLDMLGQFNLKDKSLLDIGGGIGAIQHELIGAGISYALDVDASTAYLNASKEEAERRGHSDKIEYHHGDFVQLAEDIEACDIVTLDRVVCCYPEMRALVDLSSQRAKEFYGMVYPRDNIVTRNLISVFNFFAFRLRGNPFRTYVHDSKIVESIIRGKGLKPIAHRTTGIWQVVLYQKERTTA